MIDWSRLTMMIGPLWRGRDSTDRERLARAKDRQRGGHTKGKNHSTGKRNARIRAVRAAALKKATEARAEAQASYDAQVRAYWSGERDTHP